MAWLRAAAGGGRQREPELKFTIAVIGPNAAALRLDQTLDDRQAEAGIVVAGITLSAAGAQFGAESSFSVRRLETTRRFCALHSISAQSRTSRSRA